MAEVTFTPVEEIPEITRQGTAQKALEDFLASDLQRAMVEAPTKSFGNSLKSAAKKSGLPVRVATRTQDGQTSVYIERTSE